MSSSASSSVVYLKDYQAPDWLIERTALTVALYDTHALVTATLQLKRQNHEASVLWLDGEELDLQSIAVNGQALSQQQYLLFDHGMEVYELPEQAELQTVVRIEPQNNTALEGLYRSGQLFCTQCEADGFRRITYFIDRPDALSVYQTRIEADKNQYPTLLSNGNPVAQGELPAGRHFVTWEDPFPKPCYLFALVAGDLYCHEQNFVTQSGRDVALRLYVEPQNKQKCEHAMRSLEKSMRWDEQTFGLEYDLDIYMIVAVDDFNMGAMENKGLNIFNSRFVLALPELAEDSDYEDIEAVIGHEYFHNWTGNRVTCRDWFQLSLKEGLTVFREQEFSADMNARSVKRIADVRRLRRFQFPEDAGPTAHPVRPDRYSESNNLYTATVYEKGGEVIRMLHALVGPPGFRAGMDLYFQRHDGQAVTCEDFVAAIADANNLDLSAYLSWYTQAGTPRLSVKQSFDADTARLTLTLSQQTLPTPNQPHKSPLPIPLALGLLDDNGQPQAAELVAGAGHATADGWVLELSQSQSVFVLQLPAQASAPTPSLLRGFSAPVELITDLSREQKLHLLRHDSDAFCRWDSAQQLALDELTGLAAGAQHQLQADFVDACAQALEAVINGHDDDLAFYAELFDFPDQAFLVNRLAQVDIEAIDTAVKAFQHGLATALLTQWQAVYHMAHARADEPKARALRNLSLRYLALADPDNSNQWVQQQFNQAACMTDQMGALRAATLAGLDCADELLEAFYQRWQNEPLVVNKWLSVQAAKPAPDCLQTVKKLAQHPAFDLTNPNKVRALFNLFAQWNPVGFHSAGEPAYAYIADQVLRLNDINPQVAARLVAAFNHWRKFDEVRRLAMGQQLQRIQAASALSPAVADIVDKALA